MVKIITLISKIRLKVFTQTSKCINWIRVSWWLMNIYDYFFAFAGLMWNLPIEDNFCKNSARAFCLSLNEIASYYQCAWCFHSIFLTSFFLHFFPCFSLEACKLLPNWFAYRLTLSCSSLQTLQGQLNFWLKKKELSLYFQAVFILIQAQCAILSWKLCTFVKKLFVKKVSECCTI